MSVCMMQALMAVAPLFFQNLFSSFSFSPSYLFDFLVKSLPTRSLFAKDRPFSIQLRPASLRHPFEDICVTLQYPANESPFHDNMNVKRCSHTAHTFCLYKMKKECRSSDFDTSDLKDSHLPLPMNQCNSHLTDILQPQRKIAELLLL